MKQTKSFEENLEIAKDVLDELSSSDVSLDDSMNLYKDGLKHLNAASKILEKAKLDFEELSNNTNE